MPPRVRDGRRLLNSIHLGFAFMAANAVMGALDAVIGRMASAELHPLQIVFFRNAFSLLLLLAILPRQERTLDANGLWLVHASRAVVKLVAMIAYFAAISALAIASVTAIAFSMPIFVMIGSLLFLHEKLRFHRAIAIAAGLCGMVLVIQPGRMGLGMGEVMALLSALSFACVALLMKFSSDREKPLRIVWFNLLITVPLALALALPVWVWPSPKVWALCIFQGIGGLAAQFAFARAMTYAPASLLISVDFMRLPLAAILALVLFGEQIQPEVMLGGAIIVCGILYAGMKERGPTLRGPPD